jgi:hypothetical protein
MYSSNPVGEGKTPLHVPSCDSNHNIPYFLHHLPEIRKLSLDYRIFVFQYCRHKKKFMNNSKLLAGRRLGGSLHPPTSSEERCEIRSIDLTIVDLESSSHRKPTGENLFHKAENELNLRPRSGLRVIKHVPCSKKGRCVCDTCKFVL